MKRDDIDLGRQMALLGCNISKGAKPFAEWLPQRMKELERAS